MPQARALGLLDEVLAIEAGGGMMTKDGMRRRTPGGAYLDLLSAESGRCTAAEVKAMNTARNRMELEEKVDLTAALQSAAAANADASTMVLKLHLCICAVCRKHTSGDGGSGIPCTGKLSALPLPLTSPAAAST